MCRADTCCTKCIMGVCGWRCEDRHVCMCWIVASQLKPACAPQQVLILLEAGLLESDHSHSSAQLKSICTKTEPTTKWENYCTSSGFIFFKWGFMRCLWQNAKQRSVHSTLEKRGVEAQCYSTTHTNKWTQTNNIGQLIYFSGFFFVCFFKER